MNKMIVSGIADEAGKDIATQIRAHQALGWRAIELRLIDGKSVCGQLDDESFARAAGELEESGLMVTGFASAIGNWSRAITGDFQIDVEELKKAAPRMRRLHTRMIRTMSWLQGDVSEAAWRRECLSRYRELAGIAEGEGIVLAHENCTGWAGLSGRHMAELIQEIASPHLTLLFDIGNTISHGGEPWAFYEAVRPFIGHVHVKDCSRSQDYRYPGEGDACVRQILLALVQSGYSGAIAIEPHVAAIIHHGKEGADPKVMYDSYLRYGRQFEAMLTEVTTQAAATSIHL